MACDITSGFTLGCRDNVGSIKQIYILSGSVTSVTDASEGLINAILVQVFSTLLNYSVRLQITLKT
jgi:hypothetical protein